MENLGSMEPEKLLQLFTGSLACAFVVFTFILVYIFLARRGSKGKAQKGLGTASSKQNAIAQRHYTQATPSAESPTNQAASGPFAGLDFSSRETLPVDVGARLAGTGREAWLEETSPQPVDVPAAEEHPLRHGQEVLRLIRDPITGQVWAQVAGVRYRNLSDIRDRAVGERVLATITSALRFSDGRVATDQGVVAIQLPPCDAVKVPAAIGALSEAHEAGEMIRLISDPDRGCFCIYAGGHCYSRLLEVEDRTIGQHILEAITRLLQFSNGMLATNDGVGMVPVPSLSPDAYTQLPATPEPSPPTSQSPAPASSPPVDTQAPMSPSSGASLGKEEQFLRQLMSQAPSQTQPTERPSLMSSLRRMRKKPSVEPVPSLNLAEEIDRIFQSKLMASDMASVDAKVEENPDGGVRIRVGSAYYESPDNVPDPKLRDMLKLSIAEWERS